MPARIISASTALVYIERPSTPAQNRGSSKSSPKIGRKSAEPLMPKYTMRSSTGSARMPSM